MWEYLISLKFSLFFKTLHKHNYIFDLQLNLIYMPNDPETQEHS